MYYLAHYVRGEIGRARRALWQLQKHTQAKRRTAQTSLRPLPRRHQSDARKRKWSIIKQNGRNVIPRCRIQTIKRAHTHTHEHHHKAEPLTFISSHGSASRVWAHVRNESREVCAIHARGRLKFGRKKHFKWGGGEHKVVLLSKCVNRRATEIDHKRINLTYSIY